MNIGALSKGETLRAIQIFDEKEIKLRNLRAELPYEPFCP